jgi:hypothetical protein
LRHAIAAARDGLADHAVALLKGGAAASSLTKLLGEARAIKDLSASAVFEERDMRERSDALRRFDVAFVKAVTMGQLLRWRIDECRMTAGSGGSSVAEAINESRHRNPGLAQRDHRCVSARWSPSPRLFSWHAALSASR